MVEWSDQELAGFCKKAIELLNEKRGMRLTFSSCWLFATSAGSNLHISYRNEQSKKRFCDVIKNGVILQDRKLASDAAAGVEAISDLKLKITLRIAYFIYRDCEKNMKED